MSFDFSYKETYRPIFDYFNQNIFDISEFNFDNIYFSDDIENDIFLFCTPKPEENTSVEGATLIPSDILEEIVVVINIKTKANILQAANCLIHELIHAHDFIEFSKKYYNTPYATISDHEQFEAYRRWSEFHAYALSQYHCCLYMNEYTKINATDSFVKSFKKNLKKELEEWKCIEQYSISRELGYLYALDMFKHKKQTYAHKYLPKYLNSEFLQDVLLLYDLYSEAVLNNKIFEVLPLIENVRI